MTRLETTGFSPGLQEKTQEKFPDFKAQMTLTLPENGSIFINDLQPFWKEGRSLKDQSVFSIMFELLKQTSNRELFLTDGSDLTKNLLSLLSDNRLFTERVAFLFPGRGGEIVSQYFQDCFQSPAIPNWELIKFPCQRDFSSLGVRLSLPKDFDPNQFRLFVVIDDAIVSGSTLRAIRYSVIDRYYQDSNPWPTEVTKFPQPSGKSKPVFLAYSWLSLTPSRRKFESSGSDSSIYGFEQISTVLCYRGVSGIPPCNSLSTLIRGDRKATEILNDLQRKYFPGETLPQVVNFIKQQTMFK